MPPPGVKARIDRFWRAIRRLNEIYDRGLTEYLSDENLIDASERNLQVAIEAVIDVSEAIIAKMKWRTPLSYKDSARILYENQVIDADELQILLEAIDLRNILIHNYVYITPDETYKKIKKLKQALTNIMKKLIDHMNEIN